MLERKSNRLQNLHKTASSISSSEIHAIWTRWKRNIIFELVSSAVNMKDIWTVGVLCTSETTYVRIIISFLMYNQFWKRARILHLCKKLEQESGLLLQHRSNNLIKQTFPLTNPYVKFSIQHGPCVHDESTLLPAWMSRWGECMEGRNWPYFTEIWPSLRQLTCSGIFLTHWMIVPQRWAKFKVPSLIWPVRAPQRCSHSGQVFPI